MKPVDSLAGAIDAVGAALAGAGLRVATPIDSSAPPPIAVIGLPILDADADTRFGATAWTVPVQLVPAAGPAATSDLLQMATTAYRALASVELAGAEQIAVDGIARPAYTLTCQIFILRKETP